MYQTPDAYMDYLVKGLREAKETQIQNILRALASYDHDTLQTYYATYATYDKLIETVLEHKRKYNHSDEDE